MDTNTYRVASLLKMSGVESLVDWHDYKFKAGGGGGGSVTIKVI